MVKSTQPIKISTLGISELFTLLGQVKGPELQLTVHYRHTCQHFCFYLEFSFVLLVYAGLVHSYIWRRSSNPSLIFVIVLFYLTAPLRNTNPLPLFLTRCPYIAKESEGHE